MLKHPLKVFNLSVFLQTQIFMLPVLLLFYQQNGLTLGDYFLFQGIFSLTALLFEIPAGYIGDIFPRKNILILSYTFFLMRLFLWLFFAHLGYWIILAGEILYSASKAFYSGVADGYVYDYLKEKNATNQMLKKYGRLNFSMSIGTAISSLLGAYFYSSFSQWTEANWGRNYGFLILILIEIIFNTAAIALLFALPKLPSAKKKVNGLWAKYKDLFRITKYAFLNKNIKYHMFYSGLLAGTTMVFVWSFQPLMKTALIPVFLFGVVYFANHFFRAMAGYLLHKTMRLFSLSTLGIITFVMFGLSFLIAIKMAYMAGPTLWISFAMLFFICITIGFQLTFTMASTSRIHTLISSDIRSTVLSVNNMIGRMTAGFFLILFKVLLDGVSMQTTFLVGMCIFTIGLYPLWRIVRLSKETN
jgi:MFS family permease